MTRYAIHYFGRPHSQWRVDDAAAGSSESASKLTTVRICSDGSSCCYLMLSSYAGRLLTIIWVESVAAYGVVRLADRLGGLSCDHRAGDFRLLPTTSNAC